MALNAAAGGHSFAALAAMVAAGLVGLVLLAYAIARMASGARRDKARRAGRAKRQAGARSEPSWDTKNGDRKVDPHPRPAPHRSAAIPRITDEVVPPRAAQPAAAAPARSIQTRSSKPKPVTRAPAPAAPPPGAQRDRVWNMLDEIRHVPLATRLAPIPGVPPRRPLAAPSGAPPAPAVAQVPLAAAGLPAGAPRSAPVPTAAARPGQAPSGPALPAQAASPIAAAGPTRAAAQGVPPDSDFGSSSRWSDEKREKLRRAVDRLRASRDPQPQRREGDAMPVLPPTTSRALPVSESAATIERSFARSTVSPPHEFQAPSSVPNASVRWVGPDELVVVSGHAIQGMVYVGASSRFGDVEPDPALIDDELDVDTPDGTLAGGLDAASSSYASLEPAHRGAYLKWLAAGRPANAPAVFALIFFMGLERRVIESRGQAGALPELNRLAAEMRRLVETHGMDSFSLHHHATRLAALVDMQSTGERMYKRPVPALHRSYDLPVELRLALGQVAHDQVQLPVVWAMAWLLVDQTFHLRSPMTRCPDEFRRLFEARYGERFGAGLQLPNSGRKLVLTYMPVSRKLASADGHHFAAESALDVDASCAAAGELRTLCSLCAEDLFEYCRYVGRHPAAVDSPDAQLRLPAAIRPAAVRARIAEVRLACQAGRRPANLHEAALTLWGVGLADKDSAGLLQALLVAEGITLGPGQALGSTLNGSR